MSSLILITGTIDQAEDPFNRLDFNELYYETWKDDPGTGETWKETERVPLKFYNSDVFRLVQQKGSGKTLKAMDILSQKAFFGGNVAANLGLVWHNQDKADKKDWDACINTVDDFMNLKHCTCLLDDVALWIKKWNTSQASILGEISAAGRKSGLDMICTSQRENQIPPEIRDQATEWIIPIIRVRDEREGNINKEDGTGRPVELITLHFDGAKIFKFMSQPIIGLESLMNCYSTTEKSIDLNQVNNGVRANQPGYDVEYKALEYLKGHFVPETIEHLNGKNVFDLVTPTHAFDVCSMDADGNLISDHKNLLKHLNTAKKTGKIPYLMFPYHDKWGFMKITSRVSNECSGKRINTSYIPIRGIDGVLTKPDHALPNTT